MRLFLASFRSSDRFDELVAAVGPGGRVAVVSNAVDFIEPEARAAYARNVFDPIADFGERGLAAFDLDLRRYFAAPETLGPALDGVRLVWAVGGNAFLLRRAMRQSGFDRLATARVAAGELIYGGWSAGGVVAGPTLAGLELMDDPAVTADGYDAAPIWEGLGLTDEILVPHWRSGHPESDAAERVVERLRDDGRRFRALKDGEAVIA